VCDDFSGYEARFQLGVTEAGCPVQARRRFQELWTNHGSQVDVYDVAELASEDRKRIRQDAFAQSGRCVASVAHCLAAERA
jgi:transposase